MRNRTEWSEDQKARTREVIEYVDIVEFSFSMTGKKKGCPLNHLNGRDGYITFNDAFNGAWLVYGDETDVLL